MSRVRPWLHVLPTLLSPTPGVADLLLALALKARSWLGKLHLERCDGFKRCTRGQRKLGSVYLSSLAVLKPE